jgi:broad specificity phosphatase PhoE
MDLTRDSEGLMNRFILVRHGGSTANEDGAFYNYNDSAICLTTNGIRQALNTAGVLAGVDSRWAKPGNFAVETFASEYTRTQQTARIILDQMGLLSIEPKINPLLNERDYGTAYDPVMDKDPYCTLNGSESGAQARVRARSFIEQATSLLERADVLAFSHFGTIRAIIAELLDLSDADMMARDVPNGQAFQFIWNRTKATFVEKPLESHVLEKMAPAIELPPSAPPPDA